MISWDVRTELRRYTYKPGWEFGVHDSLSMYGTGPELTIAARVPDTYHPLRMITVGNKALIPPYLSDLGPDSLGEFLLHAIQDAEFHETCEWLKRDGVLLHDPHAGRR